MAEHRLLQETGLRQKRTELLLQVLYQVQESEKLELEDKRLEQTRFEKEVEIEKLKHEQFMAEKDLEKRRLDQKTKELEVEKARLENERWILFIVLSIEKETLFYTHIAYKLYFFFHISLILYIGNTRISFFTISIKVSLCC